MHKETRKLIKNIDFDSQMSKHFTETRSGISSYEYLTEFRNEMKAGGAASESMSKLDAFI